VFAREGSLQNGIGYLCGVQVIVSVLWGLAAAAGATLFPGMQNMASVSVSLRAGRRAGYQFSLGLTLAFASQATLAVFFANYFTQHPSILVFMKEWATLVFFILAAFFFFKGYRARAASISPGDRPYHGSPLMRGMGLAFMNLLVIPYFFAFSGWLLTGGLLGSAFVHRLSFIVGAAAGAMLIYGAYARSASWIDRKAHFLTRNMNFLLGAILVVIALVQLVRINV
jgi:threonine/homoserine/homoserine lactone efflux protein